MNALLLLLQVVQRLTLIAGWLLWFVIGYAVWFITFGAVDMRNYRGNGGAARRIWRLFYPFLLSREPWPIGVPERLNLPWLRYESWRPANIKALATATVLGGVAILGSTVFVEVVTAYIGVWLMPLQVVLSALAALALLNALPRPDWTRTSISVTIPYLGGKHLFDLPEFLKAWLLVALVGLGIGLINHYAVQVNVLNGAFMNSFTDKNAAECMRVLKEFAIVLGIFTVLGPVYTWVKELFILEWTKFTTRFMLDLYTRNKNFYPVSLLRKPDNPNERIQQDVPALCRSALSFAFICVDSIVTFYLFGHILWDVEVGLAYEFSLFGQQYVIYHLLLIVLIGYAIFGSNGVLRVGKRLIGLQSEQKKLSADFRVGMVLFEKYAEPIAASDGADREKKQLWRRFMMALKNNYGIIRWQRNLGFFTSGYGRIAQLLPFIALAPFFFAGRIPFGAISQASGAFGDILASASIFVSEFDRLTVLLASVDRVGELRETLEDYEKDKFSDRPRIKHVEGGLLTIENMTLLTPLGDKLLVRDFNLSLNEGDRVLIKGPSGSGKTSILRAIVGLPLWDRSMGTIRTSTKPGHTLMLTQLAYLMSDGTLRDQLQYPAAHDASDEALVAALKAVNLPELLERVGGLDAHFNWDQLSGGERQRLMVARVIINKVKLVIADEATAALDIENEELMYQLMQDEKVVGSRVAMASVGHRPSLTKFHDYVIELAGDGNGGWRKMPASEAKW